MMEGRRARRRMIAAVVLLTGLAAVAGGAALSRRSEPAPSDTATASSRIPGPSAADEGYPTFETLEPGPRQTIVLATPPPLSTPPPHPPRPAPAGPPRPGGPAGRRPGVGPGESPPAAADPGGRHRGPRGRPGLLGRPAPGRGAPPGTPW